MNTATCRSCGATLIWCRTAGGRRMPVEAEPSNVGNLVVDDENNCRVVFGSELAALQDRGVPLYRSHFAGCPAAREHRKPRTEG